MSNILRFAGGAAAITVALLIQFGCEPTELEQFDSASHQGHVHANESPASHSPGSTGQPRNASAGAVKPIEPEAFRQTSPGNSGGLGADAPTLTIGAFNIQTFGQAKMSKPGVVSVLADIARRFDILAIQELRDKEQAVIPQFLQYVNSQGSAFAAAVGPRQGYKIPGKKTIYFEQAVYLYDTTKVELVSETYVARNPNGRMHRTPYVGHFRARGVPIDQSFSFVLMNVHIDPDDTQAEFGALQTIMQETYANHRGEDDFILLGDMNAAPHKYQPFKWMNQQYAAIPSHVMTNTAQDRAYDNIIFDANYTREFRNQAGVLNIANDYHLTSSDAKLVSDHFPVWAMFSATEAPRTEMTQAKRNDVAR